MGFSKILVKEAELALHVHRDNCTTETMVSLVCGCN